MSGKDLQIVDALDFQFVSGSKCPEGLVREITSFLDTQDTSHPFQFPQWEGTGAYFALLRRNGELRWLGLCGVFYPAGRYVRAIRGIAVNRGPVCDDIALLEVGLCHLVEECRRKRFTCIDIAPEWMGDFGATSIATLVRNGWQGQPPARSSLRLDLKPDPDQLLASFRKTTRYEIRRAEREQVEIRMARDGDDCDRWLRLYLDMALEKQFEADQPGHLRRVLRWLTTENHRGGLLLAHKDGKLLGGMVIIRSGTRCWYLLGATSKDSKFSVGHLLLWRAILWAKENGCLEYDFGGYREGATSGPAFFKSGFGGEVVHFPPPQRYVLSPSRLRVSALAARVRSHL